jgi:hypothetical protein
METLLVECVDGNPYSRWCVPIATSQGTHQLPYSAGNGRGARAYLGV